MYAAGSGIKPWRAPRAGGGVGSVRRLLAAVAAVSPLGIGFALGANGDGQTRYTTAGVEPGDTLWATAAAHYPGDDARSRVQDGEAADGPAGPDPEVGQRLELPG